MGSDITSLEGKTYGPYELRSCHEKVIEFVEVTGDSTDRWHDHAPPGWAAAALFVVAPKLLGDPALADLAKSVIHGEQRFAWERPIPLEADLEVVGKVARVRERGDVHFVGFDVEVVQEGSLLMSGSATFLMSGTSTTGGSSPEVSEPGALARGHNDPITPDKPNEPIRRSASRSDLVRYAAATRDWNPIHWDHRAAIDAGLPGVVVHGLLQAAWLLSVASRRSLRPDPFFDARFRFRSPLLAGAEATVTEKVEAATIASLTEGDREIASATINLR